MNTYTIFYLSDDYACNYTCQGASLEEAMENAKEELGREILEEPTRLLHSEITKAETIGKKVLSVEITGMEEDRTAYFLVDSDGSQDNDVEFSAYTNGYGNLAEEETEEETGCIWLFSVCDHGEIIRKGGESYDK